MRRAQSRADNPAPIREGLDKLLDEENDPGSDTEEGDEADEDSNGEYSSAFPRFPTAYKHA